MLSTALLCSQMKDRKKDILHKIVSAQQSNGTFFSAALRVDSRLLEQQSGQKRQKIAGMHRDVL